MPTVQADPATIFSNSGDSNELWLRSCVTRLHHRAEFELRKYVGQTTWQPTAIVNEAVAKVWNSDLLASGASRLEIMSALAVAVHDVAVDQYRRRLAVKRGSGNRPCSLNESLTPAAATARNEFDAVADSMDLRWALEKLRAQHPRQAEFILLRFFGGFSCQEIADASRVSISTVEEGLRQGRGRLFALLNGRRLD